MNPSLAALLTLLLSLLGNWLINRLNERRKEARADLESENRAKREDQIRFHSDRRQTYTQYLALAHRFYLTVVARMHEPPEEMGIKPIGPPNSVDFLDKVFPKEIPELLESIFILASPETVEAAEAVNKILLELCMAVYMPQHAPTLPELSRKYEEARVDLQRAVRRELGIVDLAH